MKNRRLNQMKVSLLVPLLIFVAMIMAAGNSHAAVGGMTIGGCIYTGHGTPSYSMVGPEVVAAWTTDYAPSPTTPPITDARVMIQNEHHGGTFVTYATMGLGAAGNCWEAAIPSADGITPDVPDVIAMVAAPGHAVTSREFIWDPDGRFSPVNWGVQPSPTAPHWPGGPTMGEFVHPTGVHPGAGGTGTESTWAIGPQDAYLMSYPQKTTSALHYVFYDNFTDGNDNGPVIEPGINGVTVRVFDEDGNIVATQVTGDLAFSQGGFITDDGVLYQGPGAYGYVYFQGLPGDGEYRVEADPSTVTQAANPHFTMNLPDNTGACTSGGHFNYDQPSCKWWQTYTEERGHAPEIYAWPGSPGTAGGGYLTWHAFVEKLPSSINPGGALGNPWLNGSISGVLLDSTGADPLEATATIHGGRVPPTNARFESGTAWNRTRSAKGWGGTPDPAAPSSDIIPNSSVMDGRVVLYRTDGNMPRVVGTAVATNPADFNDPAAGGIFEFTDVPPGTYGLYAMDRDLNYVMFTGVTVTVTPQLTVSAGPILYERWGARSMGFVERNGGPASGLTVKNWFKAGTIKYNTTTNANGWFLNPFWPETGQMGFQYVDMPDGVNYRGKIVTEQYQDVPTIIETHPIWYHWATHNSMNRAVGYATHNYFVDLQIEDIPAGVGNLMGAVYNDHFSYSTDPALHNRGNGVYDEAEDRLWQGWTVELHDTDASGVCGTGTLVSTHKTGKFSKGDARTLGWNQPYSYPADEIGSMHASPVRIFPGGGAAVPLNAYAPAPADYVASSFPNIGTSASETAALVTDPNYAPMPGFYEFRDLAPGKYCVKVIPKDGFARSDAAADPVTGLVPVIVAGGLNSRVDLGVNTTPPGSTWGIKLAGEIEGGVWDGMQATDGNPTSLLWMDAIALFGSPVSVKDGNDYLLGVGYQGDTRCHSYNNMLHTPGASMLPKTSPAYDPFSCRSIIALNQKPEFERRFAPGANRYTGNAAGFLWNRMDPSLPAQWKNYEAMELGIGIPQSAYKFEAAWTPLVNFGGGSVTADMCAVGLVGASFTSEPWGATVTATVTDGYTPIVGARVRGTWSNGVTAECEATNGNGQCSIILEKIEGGGTSATFNLDTIVPAQNQPWYVYNANTGGPLNGACKTSVVVYEPGFIPPPPAPPAAPTYQCSDGLDNDGDTLTDFPADPGCVSAQDDNEQDAPPPAPAPACSDGVDNDGDTLIDWPADPGCVDAADNDEFNAPLPVAQCMDGVDNDGDGLIDMADPGCVSITDNDEYNAPPPPPAPGPIVITTPPSASVSSITATVGFKDGGKKAMVNAVITVTDGTAGVNGATVSGTWTWMKEGEQKQNQGSCITTGNGSCSIVSNPFEKTNAATFMVDFISAQIPYDRTGNAISGIQVTW